MLAGLLLVASAFLDTRARVETSTVRPQIGEPFEITFEVEHEAGATLTWPDPKLLPRSFVFLGERGTRREIDPARPDSVTTRTRWALMVLEGGDIALPAFDVKLHAGGGDQVLHVAGPELVVPHALEQGEDAPRPARGFRDVPDVASASSRLLLVLALPVAALLAMVVWRLARRRKPAPPAQLQSPSERLAGLESRIAAEPERSIDHVYELTRILRSALDAHAGVERSAASDEEWQRAVAGDARLPAESRALAVKLLSDAERVKYAGLPLSELGLRDALARARAAIAALEGEGQVAA